MATLPDLERPSPQAASLVPRPCRRPERPRSQLTGPHVDEQLRERRRRHGPTEQEALGLVAAHRQEHIELPLRFDALGNHGHPEAVAHVDNAGGDCAVARVRFKIPDEGSVNIE